MAQYHEAVGRRKQSTARVRVAGGSGVFTVNEKEGAAYFTRMGDVQDILRAFAAVGEDVAKLLIEKINSNFNARYNYKNNKQYSYQIILQDNLQQLSNFIIEKRTECDFVIPKMRLSRNDNFELREKILNMTSEEQKKLGLNKSTFWYIKMNLSEGKSSKINKKTIEKFQ